LPTITYPSFDNITWSASTQIQTGFLTLNDDEGMTMDNTVEADPTTAEVVAVKVLGGWVGQLYFGDEIIWQSKKLRNDKTYKKGRWSSGSERALEDVHKRRIKSMKKALDS